MYFQAFLWKPYAASLAADPDHGCLTAAEGGPLVGDHSFYLSGMELEAKNIGRILPPKMSLVRLFTFAAAVLKELRLNGLSTA